MVTLVDHVVGEVLLGGAVACHVGLHLKARDAAAAAPAPNGARIVQRGRVNSGTEEPGIVDRRRSVGLWGRKAGGLAWHLADEADGYTGLGHSRGHRRDRGDRWLDEGWAGPDVWK